jgi:lysophospholipase L1-like esterase
MMAQYTTADPLITPDQTHVTVPAGDYHVGKQVVHVAKATVFTIDPATSTPARDEHVLSEDPPKFWFGGTHPDALRAGGTPLPDCLQPGSVVVRLPEGTEMTAGKDYLLDETWAGLSRVDGGRIPKGAKDRIDFAIGQMRLDMIEVDASGNAALRKGTPEMTCPHPPPVEPGAIAIANIFIPYHGSRIENWQVFTIHEPAFPEPDRAEMDRRGSTYVPRTLAKLRAGQPVTIVTWGDSVTAGGDASPPDRMFAQRFPAELQKRFPASKITSHNAGIGGTTTEQRLPGLQKEVLDFHPDLVTIEFVNDMGAPEAALKARYAEIFQKVRAGGAEPLLITPHFTMTQWMDRQHPRGKESRPTVALLRKIAAENQVGLADTSNRWAHLDEEGIPYVTLLHNGINHPDNRGHEMFVKDLLSFFPAK